MNAIHKELCVAVSLGQLEKVKDLINRNGVYNSGAYGYYSLLRKAVKIKHTEIINLLLTSGSDKNNKKRKIIHSHTPLHLAVLDDDLEIIEMLLCHGANINARNECGSSPLLTAIRMGKSKIVDFLLKRGTYRKTDNEFISPLYLVPEQALSSIIEKYSIRGTSMNSNAMENFVNKNEAIKETFELPLDTINLLYIAVNNCHRNPIKFITDHNKLKLKIDAEFDYEETIPNCSICNVLSVIFEDILSCSPAKNNKHLFKHNVKIFKRLLKYGFPIIDYRKQIPLHFSSLKMYYIQMIERLMRDQGLHLASDKQENVILRIITNNKQVEIVKFLYTHEPGENTTEEIKNPPTFYSTENPDANMAKFLLVNKVNIDPEDQFSNSAFKRTCTNLEVDLILSHVYCPIKDFTPLLIAINQANEETIDILLESGVNVNSKLENGDTALHIVTERCNINILKILLEYGADVYAKNLLGETPLHVASNGTDPAIVSILLQNGSSVEFQNNRGKTALDIAYNSYRESLKFEKFRIVKLLLKFGSDISKCYISNPNRIEENKEINLSEEEKTREREREVQFRFLVFHLIMLKTANLFVTQQHQWLIQNYNGYEWNKLLKEKCEDEIKALKLEKISNNNLSFYDILMKCMHSLAIPTRNEDIIRITELNNYKIKFPIYCPIIEKKLKMVILYKKAQKFFYCKFNLSYDCSDQILLYLNTLDLERFAFGIRLQMPNINIF